VTSRGSSSLSDSHPVLDGSGHRREHVVRRVVQRLSLVVLGAALPLCLLLGLELTWRAFPALLPAPIRAAPKPSLWDMFQRDPVRARDAELIFHYRAGARATAFNDEGEEVEYEYRVLSPLIPDAGFRDDGLDEDSAFRIVVLGDSFAMGGGVSLQENWVELLEQETGADVVNMGVGGYGTVQERIILERFGRELEPGLVILAFFSGNDLGDSGIYEDLATRRVDVRAKQFLGRYFYTYELIRYQLGRPVGREHVPEFDEASGDALSYQGDGLSLVFHLPHLDSMRSEDLPHWIVEGIERTADELTRVQAICAEMEAELLVVVFPSKEQVYWEIVEGLLERPEEYDPALPNSLVNDWCARDGLRVLDLTPAFRERSSQQLYFARDTHWNEAGNRLACDTIHAYLIDEGLLPGRH
jgi:hypothetical protein